MRVSKLPVEVLNDSVIGQRSSGPKEQGGWGSADTTNMRTFKTRARNGALVVGARTDSAGPDRPLDAEKGNFPMFVSNPDTRSFWLTPKLSSIVILNLIANLSFLYHKPQKPVLIRID